MGLNRDTGNVGRGWQVVCIYIYRSVVWNCYSEVTAGQNSGEYYTIDGNSWLDNNITNI